METTFFMTVLICAAITISVRALPIILLANAQIPALIREWLNFIPAAVMSAIIVAEILAKPALTAAGWSVSLLATVICVIIGVMTRSLFITVLSGILAFMMLDWVLS